LNIEDSNVFCVAGIVENPTSYNGSIALYDYLWALKPELREKLIKSWISLLEDTLKEGFLEEISPTFAEGVVTVMVDPDPIEVRDIPANVVMFRGKNGKRI
jgi:hypothetical protein